MRNATRRMMLGAALATLGGSSTVIAAPPTAAFIPVIINIYKNAGITEEQAKEAIKEANKIYSRLEVGITLVPVKTNKDVTDGDAESDGKVDWDNREYDKWNEHGKKEIEKLDNKKGIKLSFGAEPQKGKTNPGWAFHGQPMACVKNRGTKELTGATIAHEVGHIMTLKDHVETDRKNLMAPSEESNAGPAFRETDPTKLTLTPEQIEEMRKSRFNRGKCSTQFKAAFPAEKNPQQWAAKTDNSGDSTGSFAYSDLAGLTLSSQHDGVSSLDGVLTLASTFTGSVNNRYSLAINSDNNNGTGFGYDGFTGVEYAVEMTVTGSGGSYVANGQIVNLGTGSISLMSQPLIDDSYNLSDTDDPSAVAPPMEQLLFSIDKNLVGMSSIGAHFAPIGITARENSTIVDTDSTEFNLQRWLDDPTLTTSGTGVPTPGMPYGFTIDNLNPNDVFNLYLNDALVASGLLHAGGDGGGSFIWPMDVPVGANFLYAQDSTGEFAYSVTCPEPSFIGAASLGLLAVSRRRRACIA